MKFKISTSMIEGKDIIGLKLEVEGILDNTAYHKIFIALETELKNIDEKNKTIKLNYLIDASKIITFEKIPRRKFTELLINRNLPWNANKIAVFATSPLIRAQIRVIIKRSARKNVKIFFNEKDALKWLKVN